MSLPVAMSSLMVWFVGLHDDDGFCVVIEFLHLNGGIFAAIAIPDVVMLCGVSMEPRNFDEVYEGIMFACGSSGSNTGASGSYATRDIAMACTLESVFFGLKLCM